MLRIEPEMPGSVTIVTVRVAPFGTIPSWHVTTPAAWLHVPEEAFAETNANPLGSVSTSVVEGARSGPLFVTVAV